MARPAVEQQAKPAERGETTVVCSSWQDLKEKLRAFDLTKLPNKPGASYSVGESIGANWTLWESGSGKELASFWISNDALGTDGGSKMASSVFGELVLRWEALQRPGLLSILAQSVFEGAGMALASQLTKAVAHAGGVHDLVPALAGSAFEGVVQETAKASVLRGYARRALWQENARELLGCGCPLCVEALQLSGSDECDGTAYGCKR